MFDSNYVDLNTLKKRAYNLRWATVPNGVIPLTAADPDFPCAPEITAAIQAYISDRYLSYGPPEGLLKLRESISQFYHTKRNCLFSPEFILPVDSAAFGIFIACKALLQKDDEAIIFDPVDFLFRYSIEQVGAKAVSFPIPANTHFLDINLLESLVTPKTKLLCLCNPLNPTGKVFTKAELAALVDFADKHQLMILSDEIWSDIVFEPHVYTSISSINETAKNLTVVVNGFSKSYGLAGLRIGMLMAPNQKIYSQLFECSLHSSTVHGVNILSQIAAISALDECGYWLTDFVKHLQEMRNFCVDHLNQIANVSCVSPQGCYVAFANITRTGKSSSEIHQYLLNEAKVAVVPGLAQWFGPGAEGYIRLSFASSKEILEDALFRISTALNKI